MSNTCIEIYEQTVQAVENFYSKMGLGEVPDLQPINAVADQLCQATETLGAPLLQLCRQSYEDKTLSRHVIHVAVVALILGRAVKLKPEQLPVLAGVSLLFDIGMMKIRGNGMTEIKEHPELGAKLLETLPGVTPEAIQVTLQHHERRDGSGYPKGLKDQEISPMARIVALADIFCNLARIAPQQRSLSLHEVIQELLKGKSLFDEKCLKALFENVTFYPKGTWVALSTGEMGVVTGENQGLPLRPIIKLYSDSDGDRIYEECFVDLKKMTNIFIKRVYLEERLKEKGVDTKWS